MAYYRSNNSGCGCAFFIVIILFAAVVSGIRGVVSGDIKLPRSGSHRVSGGSGGYGTSNGYTVRYKTTTAPNYNSSNKDYSHTDNQPTEYREGNNNQSSNTSRNNNAYNSSCSPNSNSSYTNTTGSNNSEMNSNIFQKPSPRYRTCSLCNGSGKQAKTYWYYGEDHPLGSSIIHCGSCNRTDTHSHQVQVTCEKCWGKGKVEVRESSLLGGEVESPIIDLN